MQDHLNRGTDVALFIDWENFKISLAVGHRTPNVSALKEEVSNYGRVVIAKAYADWVTRAPELRGASQFLNDPPSLYAAGIEPVFVPTRAPSPGATNANGIRTGRIKNSVDVKMTADCIEIAHSYPNIGTYVLVSGDSDFIHVVNALRTMGKKVIVIGISWSTSRRLADQVDTLVLYDVDVDPVVPPEAASEASSSGKTASDPSPDQKAAGDLQDMIRAIEEIIRDERKAGGNPLLTSIKQRLMRRYPDFDEKKLGYSGFKRLMARVAQDGKIRLITAGLVDWAIMADEDIPEGATEATFSSPGSRPGRRRGRLPRSRQKQAETQPDEGSQGVADSPGQPEQADATTELEPAAAITTNGQHDSDGQPEYRSGASATPDSPFGGNTELSQAIEDAISNLGMPTEPDDGLLAERVSDLLVMANTLEHQEGVSHVAFNFLVSEICDALAQGLDAGHEEITQRWGQTSSRTYVSKILRGLSDGDFFLKGNHSWRDETSGQSRRRRTFNLNHDHPLVQQAIAARSGDGAGPAGEEGHTSVSQDEPPEAPETTENTGATDITETTGTVNDLDENVDENVENGAADGPSDFSGDSEYDDEDYESGKEAAERRVETGFISRLFRPRRN